MWFTPTSWLQQTTDRWFGLTLTAKYDICDWVRSYDVQVLGNWLGGVLKMEGKNSQIWLDLIHGQDGATESETFRVESLAKQVIIAWQLTHMTESMLCENLAPSQLPSCISAVDVCNHWIHKGPERKAPQPYDSLHFCDVAICSWILISPPIDSTSMERFCLQLNAKMESKEIF